MSEIGELLELLHGARGRYRTARGVLRHWSILPLSQQAHERWQEELRAAGHSSGTSFQMVMAAGERPSEPQDRSELVLRFWSEPPKRLREETQTIAPLPHEHMVVRDGTRWWSYSPEWGAMSNVAAGAENENVGVGGGELWTALLDPSTWIPVLDFEREGDASLLGRAALRVRARPRAPRGHDPFHFHAQLPVGADEYEFLFERERGVALRAAALLDGEEFWCCEFEELVFDERFPPETFVFEPPPGEEIRSPDIGLHEPLTIEEAAERASFRVFYVPELPEGRWDLHVTYSPARNRPPMKESVHLAYHRSDALHHLMVTERAAEAREPGSLAYPHGVETHEVERDGVTFTVYRPERPHAIPLTVAFKREGTAVELNSQNLDEETLLRLAASMVSLR